MSKQKSPNQIAFDDFIKTTISPLLKKSGYKKSGFNFNLRNEKVSIVINFQSSSGSSWSEKLFYINIGFSFDEICLHKGYEISSKLKESDCQLSGISFRINEVYSQLPACFRIFEAVNTEQLKVDLAETFSDLVNKLALITDLASYQKHDWFDLLVDRPGLKVLICVLLNNRQGAEEQIDKLLIRFADREKLNQRDHWYKKYDIQPH